MSKMFIVTVTALFTVTYGIGRGYIKETTALSWQAANDACNTKYGTTLATVIDDDDKAAYLEASGGSTLWVGLSDIGEEGVWQWADNTVCTNPTPGYGTTTNQCIDYWQLNQPDDAGPGEDCMAIYWSGPELKTNDATCSTIEQYMCNANYVQTDAYIIVTETSIPPDSNYCQNNFGSTLATVRSAEDKANLRDAFIAAGLTPGSDHVWIGLNDRLRQGDFEWWDGTSCLHPGVGYTGAVINKCIDYWNTNEPNGNEGQEDCTEVWFQNGVTLTANDSPCDNTYDRYTACNIGGAQVDCVVSFGEWSSCSQPCGDGIETRTGTIETQPENGGAACPALTEEQHCNLGACPIDCVVSSFSEWSTCTKLLCGNGEQTRTRIITTHPQNGGEECDPLSETQNCNTQSCCPSGIKTFNWDTMIEEHINAPSVEDLVFGVDSTDLTLNIYVELPYLGKTSADNQREAKFGTTYVIDFEDFNAHSDAINEPGTCQNRMESSFTGKDFNDIWTYSLEPQNTNGIGNLNTLSYPPSDKWSISMKDNDCDTIIYERSFTWQELRDCSGFNGEAFTSLIHEDNKYKLSGTMYINVVSPFWYDSDFGYYRVYQLLSKPFIITVSSTINVLGSTGINLITMWIIAVYKENQESDFRLVLMTETAEYLTLTRGAPNNEIFNFQKAISNTNNMDSNIFTVSNEPEAGCLNNRDYICTQLWNIDAINPGCTSGIGGIGTDFSGTYELGFTPQCKDTNDVHCEQFLNDHIDIRDNLLIETNLVWKDDICEPELFELQFVANMLFYINDEFIDNEDIATVYNIAGTDKNTYLYQAGVDRIYVEINTDFPKNTFEIFNTELTNVWICTFPPNILPKTFKDVIDPNQDIKLNEMGCFNSAKDSSLSNIVNDIYPITDTDIVEFISHTESETNIIRFSFLIPQEVTRDTLYIHAQIEVELQEAIPRRRILLDVNTANQISHFGQQVGVTNKNKNNNKKPPINEPQPQPQLPINNPINISLKSPLVIIICSLLALILTVNICYMCYVNWYKHKTRKGKGYEKVKRIDSEFDIDSEAQMLDNQ